MEARRSLFTSGSMLEVAFTYSLSLKNVLLNSCAVVRVRQPTQTAVASEYDSPTTTYLSVFHEGGGFSDTVCMAPRILGLLQCSLLLLACISTIDTAVSCRFARRLFVGEMWTSIAEEFTMYQPLLLAVVSKSK